MPKYVAEEDTQVVDLLWVRLKFGIQMIWQINNMCNMNYFYTDFFFLYDNPEGDLCVGGYDSGIRGGFEGKHPSNACFIWILLPSANQLWTRTVRNSVWDTQERWGPILIIICRTIL